MANQVITVNRRKYAVGMFWQPTGAGFSPRNYARSLARSVNRKLNLYTEYRSMTGLGSRRMGHRVGMPSAAAEIIDSLGEYSSFLAVFHVGKCFYLVAVRNGVILEDKLFNNAEDARREYAKLFEIPDWSVLIAPGVWGMPRAIERNISDVVTGHVHAILHQIGRIRGFILSVLLLGGFTLLMLGVFKGPIGEMLNSRPKISQIDPELAEEYKKRIEEKNKELDEQFNIEKSVPEPVPELVLPYDNLPNVEQRAKTCYQAMGFLMQPISGWVQVSVECGEENASAKFRRNFGTLGDFYNIATELMPHSFIREESEDSVVVSAILPRVETAASRDERNADTIVRDITTKFQSMDTPVDINVVVDTLTNGVETVNMEIVEIAASSKLVPMQFMEIFNDFGGVYMTRCAWDATKRIWNYEVIIYAK